MKTAVFLPLYVGILLLLERKEVDRVLETAQRILPQGFQDLPLLRRWTHE